MLQKINNFPVRTLNVIETKGERLRAEIFTYELGIIKYYHI